MSENKCSGFTLIELMIVVAIIGILSATAIPKYANFQLKSKTTEAKICLHNIALAQISYRSETDKYVVCAANPAGLPNPIPQIWNKANGDFEVIGFAPKDTHVRYQYESTSADLAVDFTATAIGDLDGNGVLAEFIIQHNTAFAGPVISGAF